MSVDDDSFRSVRNGIFRNRNFRNGFNFVGNRFHWFQWFRVAGFDRFHVRLNDRRNWHLDGLKQQQPIYGKHCLKDHRQHGHDG